MRKSALSSSRDALLQTGFFAIEKTLRSRSRTIEALVFSDLTMLGEGTRVWGKSRLGEAGNNNNNNNGAASPIRSEGKGPTREIPPQPRAVASRLVSPDVVH